MTRKVTRAAAAIKLGLAEKVSVGNLDACRDWGHAADYVEGMHLILNAEKADDFVLATGETHSVRELVETAFHLAGFDLIWKGSGIDEIGLDRKSGRILVEIDPKFFRPTEVELL